MNQKEAMAAEAEYNRTIELLQKLSKSIQEEQTNFQSFPAKLGKIATPRMQYEAQLQENESVARVPHTVCACVCVCVCVCHDWWIIKVSVLDVCHVGVGVSPGIGPAGRRIQRVQAHWPRVGEARSSIGQGECGETVRIYS